MPGIKPQPVVKDGPVTREETEETKQRPCEKKPPLSLKTNGSVDKCSQWGGSLNLSAARCFVNTVTVQRVEFLTVSAWFYIQVASREGLVQWLTPPDTNMDPPCRRRVEFLTAWTLLSGGVNVQTSLRSIRS